MKTIENYIDELKIKTGSDYQTAVELGVDRSVISKIRSRGAVSDENAIKIADLLGIDETEILIAATLARSDGRVREAWMRLSKRAGIAATLMIVAVMTSSFSTWKEAKAGYSEYTLCEVVRRWLRRKAIFTMPVGIVAA